MKILQVANYKEGVGGIAVQVKLLRDNLVADGFACDILSTKGSVFKRLKAIVQLFTKGKNYDVFHIHACSGRGFFPAVVGVLVGRILNRRIVLTYHGGGAVVFFRRRTNLVKFILTKTDHNIVLSGFTGQVYDKYGIEHTIIPNIVEMDTHNFRQRTQIQPRFISIRSLTETYNIECTINAFRSIKERFPNAELSILGDGQLRQHLENYVKDNEIKGISFKGQIDNSSINSYLDAADIMISSSRFDNMPVSILEGFNAGLLVIASNVGGIPYMIEDKKTGLLFDSNNSEQLAGLMTWALNHIEESLRIANNGHEEVKKYSWESIRENLIPLYSNVIE